MNKSSVGKHTPGPWSFDESYLCGDFMGYSISGRDENGCHILPTLAAVHNFPDNIKANARLIAAAPDLLEAAKNVMLMGSMEDSVNAYSALRDAIEKATGEMI